MLEKDISICVGERSFTEGGTSAEERMLQRRASGAAEMKRGPSRPGGRFN